MHMRINHQVSTRDLHGHLLMCFKIDSIDVDLAVTTWQSYSLRLFTAAKLVYTPCIVEFSQYW